MKGRSQQRRDPAPHPAASRRSGAPRPADRLRLLMRALGCALLVAGQSAAGETLSSEAFLATPAAGAFKEGRFEDARVGFEALLSEYPGDTLLLRYLGLSYDRLEQYDKAIAAYERGLEQQPDSAPLHLFLGITAFKIRDVDRACAAFRRTIDLAPETPYAQHARRYLEALRQQAASYQKQGAPRRWDVYAQLGSQYDSNPLALAKSSDGDTDDVRFTQYLHGAYDVLHGEHWRIRGEVSSYHSQHPGSRFDQVDLNSVGATLAVSYTGSLLGRPMTTNLRYGADWTFVDQDRFSTDQQLATRVSVGFTPNTLTQLFHEFRVGGFREDGFDRDISSRDALVNVVGLAHYLFFAERRHYLWLDYRYRHTDADGSNFDTRAHAGLLGGSVGLPQQFRADLSVAYEYEAYVHFFGIPDRRSRRWTGSAAVSRPLIGGLSVSLSYLYADEDSNYRALDHDRHVATLTLGNRF